MEGSLEGGFRRSEGKEERTILQSAIQGYDDMAMMAMMMTVMILILMITIVLRTSLVAALSSLKLIFLYFLFLKVRLRLCAAPPPGSRDREEV